MPDTEIAIWFFTFLTLLANLVTFGTLAAACGAPRLWARMRSHLVEGGLGLAWLVAAVATVGSLYFSEVAGFLPCRLCWAQRACMYPLVLVLAVAAVWPRARRLGLVLASTGAVIAGYHVLVERFPSLESGTCDPDLPCSLVWFERLGFVTLPSMALSGFLLIVTLLLVSRPSDRTLAVTASTPSTPSTTTTFSTVPESP